MRRFGWLVVGLVLWTSAANAQDMKALERGEVLVKVQEVKGSDAPRAIVTAIIDAPPEDVWRLVSDCKRYSKIFDRIKRSKLLEQKGSEYVCEVEIELLARRQRLHGGFESGQAFARVHGGERLLHGSPRHRPRP